MPSHHNLEEGQLLKYVGKSFDSFDSNRPFMKFLGYDSYGWNELWVNYEGSKLLVHSSDVEIVREP